MPTPEQPRAIAIGLADEELAVAAYFDAFPWEGAAPDAATLSAEDFLAALGP